MSSLSELFDLVGVLARRRYLSAERALSAVGFNHTEARLLNILSGPGAMPQDTLSERLIIDRTNAGRALKSLEARAYVTRRRDAADKRSNIVRITKKGRRAVMEIRKVREQLIEEFFRDLPEKDAATIVALLKEAFAEDLRTLGDPVPGTERSVTSRSSSESKKGS